MLRQFVSTCYLVWQNKFLLIFHEKHQKWLPPGGHLEEGESPPETARREVREESGLEIQFILQENLWINQPNAKSIERPFSCLLEYIPSYKEQEAHEHIDFIYVAEPAGGTLIDGKWFTLEEVEQFSEEKIFLDAKKTMRQIADFLLQTAVTTSRT